MEITRVKKGLSMNRILSTSTVNTQKNRILNFILFLQIETIDYLEQYRFVLNPHADRVLAR